MAVTNDKALADSMARLHTHGITRDPKHLTKATEGPWYYEQLELGLNYHMTDIQTALGLSQLDRLEEFVARHNELGQCYEDTLKNLPVQRQIFPQDLAIATLGSLI